MQWERGEGEAGEGKQQGVQHILTVPDIPKLSIISSSFHQQEFVSPPPARSEILVLPCSFPSLLVGTAFLSSSACLVLPLLLAGVWLWAQPGSGGGIPSVPGLTAGTKLSLEGLSLGSHPQPLKSHRQEGDITWL